ncbi:MAG: class D beta-lactamase [Flammeovirgaceae bacterium]
MRRLLLFVVISFLIACSSENQSAEEASNTTSAADSVSTMDTIQQIVAMDTGHNPEMQSLGFYFEKYEVDGAFLLFDPQEDKYYTYHGERADEAFLPASTFKILNSLIALETGVIADTNVVLTWDGKERENPEWNQDQNMIQAFQNSTVWFYQELARRIGVKRMQHYINKSNYGNEKMGGKIDDFWLNGDLRISMNQQVTFLRKLYRNELPFSKRNQEKVKGLMVQLETDKYKLYGKTGWAVSQQIGWFVGFVMYDYEEEEIVIPNGQDTLQNAVPDSLRVVKKTRIKKGYYFATNIDVRDKKDAVARKNITIDMLKSLKIID